MGAERRGARSDTLVGVLIVVVSVIGAFVTRRAADAANEASELELRGRQAAIFGDQVRREYESVVSYERRLFDAFRDHVRTADAPERDATRLDRGDRALSSEPSASRTAAEAFAEGEIAYLNASTPREYIEAGRAFDRAIQARPGFARAYLSRGDAEFAVGGPRYAIAPSLTTPRAHHRMRGTADRGEAPVLRVAG